MRTIKFFRNYFPDIVSGLLVFLFVYASVSKIVDHENFGVELGKSPLLTKFTSLVAWGIPGLELGIAGLLATKHFRLPGLYAAYSMLVIFTAYLIAILKFSFFIPCTCGGVLQNLNWDTHIIFNSIFILLTAMGIFLSPPGTSKHFLLQ